MARASTSSSSSSDSSSQIRHAVGDFVDQLSTLIEQDAVARAREAIMSAFSGSDAPNLTANGKRRGRPPGSGRRAAGAMLALAGVAGGVGKKKRKKAPIQLCPVPGCNNRAAPVFGMVCAKHKDLPKAEIRKFREARRAKRDKAQGNATKTPAKARARRKPVKRKARVARAAPRSATPPAAKAAATA
jgi:hypothetical protein